MAKTFCSVSGQPMLAGKTGKEYRNYLGMSVLEAAKERARYLFGNFDIVSVNFSGGKDSLAVLELLDMVRIELGIARKIVVLFYDQELFPNSHIKFLTDIYESQRFEFYWICAPINSQKYMLGDNRKYVQWDIAREFLRQPPPFAITYFYEKPIQEGTFFATYLMPKFLGQRVVNCTGMRAAESLNRAKAITKSSNYERPYIIAGQVAGLYDAKPIYDWQTKDVFKFFYDFNIKYAPVYETQVWSENDLRVATPFTNEGAKNLDKLRDGDPEFYNRLIQVFPEMRKQANYYRQMDNSGFYEKYGISEEGIFNFIKYELQGQAQVKALEAAKNLLRARRDGHHSKNVTKTPRVMQAMYPLEYIFYSMIIGSYKRNIQHLPFDKVEENLKRIDAGEIV